MNTKIVKHSPLNPLYQLRRLYDWTMNWSEHPHGVWALGALSAVEGIFFPIPVDPFLIAMGAAKPKKSLWYSLVAAMASIIGGSIGYLLGFMFWEYTQDFFFTYFFKPDTFELVIKQFQDNAFVAVFMASFTPIPYKVFAVAGGVAHISYLTFFAASLIGRSMRFFLIGGFLYFYGPSIRKYLDKHFDRITIVTCVVLVLGYGFYKLFAH
ncbi:MAG: DedA family protein [Bdellovibrionaceae bacterium]|jgi:membrane protein YqaA with SNARE-associated domain|nr:DedA family protein [Pseudobdellovibrionaceae bacterium]